MSTIPAMTRADSYDDVSSVDGPLQEYFKARASSENVRNAILGQLLDAMRGTGMLEELGIPSDVDAAGLEEYVEQGKLVSPVAPFCHCVWTFVRHYFIKLG